MSRLTANLFMNSFNENLECLKTVLKRKDLWQDLCDAYKEALCEIADRTRMDSWIASKLFLKYNYGIEVRSSKPLQPNQRALFINDKLYAIINVTQPNAILAAKGLLWLGMIEVAAKGLQTWHMEDLWEIKKATVWFDNKSMPLDTFKAKCLGQILLTGPYKVYIKRTGTQVDKLNTVTFK